ncbi:potassium channel family protein [Undibacterium sp. SXout11W]|uniref:potassium channel family protein n=1 Tax=Undibacterium sp. SXout11W TaxID=3413050 RepID=UPI003BF1FC66
MKNRRQKNKQQVNVSALSQRFFSFLSRPLLLTGLLLSIPAFYLLLDGETDSLRFYGRVSYACSALLMSLDTMIQWRRNRVGRHRSGKMALDLGIICGCVLSALPAPSDWGVVQWLLRLALCAAIVLRIATLVLQQVRPGHLAKMMSLAVLMLTSAGAGFYWLEPNVNTYANGVWLAFTTVATVGYGDIVPSTPASKIFAVFIVLFGYAMFSIVTANIAALFVGEEEAALERELHADIRALSREVAGLREELRSRDALYANLLHGSGQVESTLQSSQR